MLRWTGLPVVPPFHTQKWGDEQWGWGIVARKKRGRGPSGLGKADGSLLNHYCSLYTASCINTFTEAAKKQGVSDDLDSNIIAVLCKYLN